MKITLKQITILFMALFIITNLESCKKKHKTPDVPDIPSDEIPPSDNTEGGGSTDDPNRETPFMVVDADGNTLGELADIGLSYRADWQTVADGSDTGFRVTEEGFVTVAIYDVDHPSWAYLAVSGADKSQSSNNDGYITAPSFILTESNPPDDTHIGSNIPNYVGFKSNQTNSVGYNLVIASISNKNATGNADPRCLAKNTPSDSSAFTNSPSAGAPSFRGGGGDQGVGTITSKKHIIYMNNGYWTGGKLSITPVNEFAFIKAGTDTVTGKVKNMFPTTDPTTSGNENCKAILEKFHISDDQVADTIAFPLTIVKYDRETSVFSDPVPLAANEKDLDTIKKELTANGFQFTTVSLEE